MGQASRRRAEQRAPANGDESRRRVDRVTVVALEQQRCRVLVLGEIRRRVARRAVLEEQLRELVIQARQLGHTWGAIGGALETSPQAAQQRYTVDRDQADNGLER